MNKALLGAHTTKGNALNAILVEPPPAVELTNKGWLLHPEAVACHGITGEVWGKLVIRITKSLYFLEIYGDLEEEFKYPWAEILLDQALAFLRVYAGNPSRSYAPSHPVDIAWHEFMLYSPFYVPFCNWLAGHYIHHVPDDMVPVPDDARLVEATVAFMEEEGIQAIGVVWPGRARCHTEGGGCHIQPPPGR